MRNALKHNYSKFILVGKIKGLSGEAKKARKIIINNKGATPAALNNVSYRKFLMGISIRHHLLPYAFLKGKTYKSVENNCGEFNAPHAPSILKIIELHAPAYLPAEPATNTPFSKYNPTLEDVQAWIKGEVICQKSFKNESI